MGESRCVYRVLVGNLRKRNHLEDLGVDGSIRMDLQEVGWRVSTGVIWLRIGTGGGHF